MKTVTVCVATTDLIYLKNALVTVGGCMWESIRDINSRSFIMISANTKTIINKALEALISVGLIDHDKMNYDIKTFEVSMELSYNEIEGRTLFDVAQALNCFVISRINRYRVYARDAFDLNDVLDTLNLNARPYEALNIS